MLLLFRILTFVVGVVWCVWHESAFWGLWTQSSMVFLCGDDVLEDVCVSWLFGACDMVGDFEGWLSFESMARVGVCHVSRITLFSFAFEIFVMFLQTGWEANS